MLERIIGVLKLDANTFEEIEADKGATGQAAAVVAIVAVIAGVVGGAIAAATDQGTFMSTLLTNIITAFVGWLVWSAVTYFVGTSLFGGNATFDQMLRVMGYAQAPGILAIIPICGAFVGWIWTLAASFIAIRQGLDLDNTKAALTAGVAFIVVLVIGVVIGLIFGAGAAAVGALQN